jgi:hypothetical protein
MVSAAALKVVVGAEKLGSVLTMTDFLIAMVSMTVFETLCAAGFADELEQALRCAVIMTFFQLIKLIRPVNLIVQGLHRLSHKQSIARVLKKQAINPSG